MAWDPAKSFTNRFKQPGKSAVQGVLGTLGPAGQIAGAASTIYDYGGKNEKKLMNQATGGLAGQFDEAISGAGSQVDTAISGLAPKGYMPGGHTINTSPFDNSDAYQSFYEGFKGKSDQFGGLAQSAQGRQAPTLNQVPQSEFRDQQMGLAQQLAQQAAGQGPSLATMQMNQNTDDAIRSAMALAASGRSGTAGGRLKMAQDQAAQYQQQGARDSAMLRAQEQLAARQQLAGVLGQGRGQDIGIARDDANLALGQSGLDDRLSLGYGQLGLNYDKLGLDTQFQSTAEQRDLEKLRLEQYLREQALRQQGIASENNMNAGIISGVGQGLGTAAAGGFFGSDRNLKTNIKDGDEGMKGFLAKLADQLGIKDEPKLESDGDRMKEFMSRIKSYEYDYKDPEKYGEGTQLSPMAQDLEKDPISAALVMDTPDGKMVDYGPRAGGIALAGLATLSKENDELKAMVEKLAKKRGA